MIYSQAVHQRLVDKLNQPFRKLKINPNTITVTGRGEVQGNPPHQKVWVEYRYVDPDFRMQTRRSSVVVHRLDHVLRGCLPAAASGPHIVVADTTLPSVLYAIEQQGGVVLTSEDVRIIHVADHHIELYSDPHSLGWFGSVILSYEVIQ